MLGLVGKLVVAVVIGVNNVEGEDSARWRTACGREWSEMVFPRLILGKGVGEQGESCLLLTRPATAMFSYLYVIKCKHPLLIGTFLDMGPEG